MKDIKERPLDVDPDAYSKYSAKEQEDLVIPDLVVERFEEFYNKYIKR